MEVALPAIHVTSNEPGPTTLPSAMPRAESCSMAREGLVSGKLGPVRPAQLGVGKNRVVLLAAQAGGALGILLALVEALQEQEERELFDGVERIGQAAGPEFVPEGIDL